MTIDPRRVKAAEIRERMIGLATERGPAKVVDPMEVAVAIAGKDEKVWRRLMKPIKDEATRLAKRNQIVIVRKGKPVEPDKIRGLWRYRLLAEGEAPPVFAPADAEDDLDDDDILLGDDEE
jgi:hypothetical protein